MALATTHVDDIALAADRKWLTEMHGKFKKRFGKMNR